MYNLQSSPKTKGEFYPARIFAPGISTYLSYFFHNRFPKLQFPMPTCIIQFTIYLNCMLFSSHLEEVFHGVWPWIFCKRRDDFYPCWQQILPDFNLFCIKSNFVYAWEVLRIFLPIGLFTNPYQFYDPAPMHFER